MFRRNHSLILPVWEPGRSRRPKIQREIPQGIPYPGISRVMDRELQGMEHSRETVREIREMERSRGLVRRFRERGRVPADHSPEECRDSLMDRGTVREVLSTDVRLRDRQEKENPGNPSPKPHLSLRRKW